MFSKTPKLVKVLKEQMDSFGDTLELDKTIKVKLICVR